jgi:hypothetical protein
VCTTYNIVRDASQKAVERLGGFLVSLEEVAVIA